MNPVTDGLPAAPPTSSVATTTHRPSGARVAVATVCAAAASVAALALIEDPRAARAAAVAAVCLALWLFELVPGFVPTLLLAVLVPVVVGGEGASFKDVLAWAADPVLALFFGGFALARAAERSGVADQVAALVVAAARGRRARLVVLVMFASAFLSMWISNIAAAALLLATTRPLAGADRRFQGALALAVAVGANVGGMATPVGTGPNAIAIASSSSRISFLSWMAFALPLTIGLLMLAALLVRARLPVTGTFDAPRAGALSSAGRRVLLVFTLAVALWLAEPLHGVPAALVALGAAVALFVTGLLHRDDLAGLDWSTLLLIAGGIMLGTLLEQTGLVHTALAGFDPDASPVAVAFVLVLVAAISSALMSNTATAALLIPLGATLLPGATTPVLIAVGCSLGMPFVISTPPNAMAHGTGAVSSRDLLFVGLPLMIVGALVVATTGPVFLRWFGL